MSLENIATKFDYLFNIISTSRFLKMEALGGEIPFYIAAYNAQQELEIQDNIRRLQKKLNTSGIQVLEINLYDISIEILQEELGMEELFEIEEDMATDKEEFKDALQSVLEIHEVLMPRIKNMIDKSEAKVYFLTGIGLVFPFMRSHNILNNLQNIAKDAPTVAFFPGKYNGHSLNLFDLLKDDNYYRAFDIEKIKI